MKKLSIGKIVMNTASSAAGGVAVVVAGKFSPLSPIITTGILGLVGAALPELAPKNEMLKCAGHGMVGAAAAKAVQSFFPSLASVSGADEDMDIMEGLGESLTVDEDYASESVAGTNSDVVGESAY